MRNSIRRVLLRLQRIPWRPPPALRSPLRKLLRNAWTTQMVEVPDWSTPLIDRGQNFVALDDIAPSLDQPIVPESRGSSSTPLASLSSATRRLRCAFVLDGLWPGGVSEFVMLLARRLPGQGIDVCIVDCDPQAAVSPPGRYQRQALEAGIPIYDGSTRQKAVTAFETWAPDVISEQGLTSAEALEAAHELRIPIVEVLHGMHSYLEGFTDAYRRASERTSVFVAVSELVRQQYLSLDDLVSPERVVTIPNALDKGWDRIIDRDRARQNLGIGNEFLVVSLGRYCLQKNVVGLVRAFGRIADRASDAHLLVAGHAVDEFHYAQAVEARAATPAPHRIHLRGETSSPDVLLVAADAFVLDSFFEGWSLASMEAVYAGVPVVMTEVAGAAEQIGAAGERGIMVPNPVGHAGVVDWNTIRRIAYGEQLNTARLGDALLQVHRERDRWLERRSQLHQEAHRLFAVDNFIAAHTDVLREAATLAPSSRAQ